MTRPALAALVLAGLARSVFAAAPSPAARFHAEIEPMLAKYCYDCHGDGMSKGKVSFDTFASDAEMLARSKLWFGALKNVRAGLMPPDDGPRPTPDEIQRFETWVKYDALAIDPANPDPGRVTVRRLNRIEYRNTVRDLMGVDFNSTVEFPPDDTGDGFDNNGEVLTVSPLLLEKYLQAAETVVDLAVPKVPRVAETRTAGGSDFRPPGGAKVSGERLDAGEALTVSHTFTVARADAYRLVTDLEIRGSLVFDPREFTVVCRVDGAEQFREVAAWHESQPLRHQRDLRLAAGDHVVSLEIVPHAVAETVVAVAAPVEPAPPEAGTGKKRPAPTGEKSRLSLRVNSVQLAGPLDPAHWVPPANYARFFPAAAAPTEPAALEAYTREVLQRFATRAFRRPVDAAKVDQLAAIAREFSTQPGQTFETGIARAMMAVLASPRFLYRLELPAPGPSVGGVALIDEYALASRLSYFLWSSLPDEELTRLAARGELRKNLSAQVARLLRDPRTQALAENFPGQWLQARDVESVPINPRVVLGAEAARALLPVRGEFDIFLRESMRRETEAAFAYVVREDRSVLELIDCDYVFLNERLAKHYGLPPVPGEALQRVSLPPGSPRGGVLTQGTFLAVTSNPTRTSPVKRGLFVLDNILGIPPPPPPPNIPALEDAKKNPDGHEPTLRELLAAHRADTVCSSCHQRMDPLGLALENFTALGTWRDTEAGQPITPAGQLVTGETFNGIRELKQLLTHERRLDYYRCLSEKLLTYALGRGIIPADLQTIDDLVVKLDAAGGRFSVLLDGMIAAPAFQKQRVAASPLANLRP